MNIVARVLWSAFLLLAAAGLLYYGSKSIGHALSLVDVRPSFGRLLYAGFAMLFVLAFWYWIIWVIGRRLFISLWRDDN